MPMAGHPDHQPGTYVKGDTARVASTPADAVALVFDGFVRQDDSEQTKTEKAEPAPSRPTPETGDEAQATPDDTDPYNSF